MSEEEHAREGGDQVLALLLLEFAIDKGVEALLLL